MSKAVLFSIHPNYCELIAKGKKLVEVRKRKPKIETPFKVYIYMTAGHASYPVTIDGVPMICHNNGGRCVIGEFICNKVDYWRKDIYDDNTIYLEELSELSCVREDDLLKYADGGELYGLNISDLVIYDKPKELSEFYRECEKNECDNCPYLHFENTPCSYEGECTVNEKIPIKRAPQSYCFVEEV